MRHVVGGLTVAVLVCLTLGCPARFSPEVIRNEIERQRGLDPLRVVELNLGRFTTLLLQSVMARDSGEIPFAGLRELQLASYEAPNELGPAIDVTRIAVQGWEPVFRIHDSERSGMVLVRPGRKLTWRGAADDGTIGDLVVVGAGRRKVVYARLRGTLNGQLPARMGDLLRSGGPDEVRRVLSELSGQEPGS